MKPFLYFFFIILFVFFSCSKEDTVKTVLTGIYDTDFIQNEFSPPIKIELSFDTFTGNHKGKDSIDMNQDGVYDIIISHRIHLPPESGTPSYEHFPYFSLSLKNGFQVATIMQFYPVGHGQFGEIQWVDALNYQTRINEHSEWSKNNVFRMMWAIPPVGAAPYGPWYNLNNEEKFIGIRNEIGANYKYGWIKVKAVSRDNLQFLSSAIEK
ncbi:MAG: hypothetical protein JNK09_01890 [Prolixibacteraceae bacterium]|nr:hypothetical protein [Prolixibacteraceae bacterium]